MLPVVEYIEECDDVRRFLACESIVKGEEKPLVIRIFPETAQEKIECLVRSSLHCRYLSKRCTDKGKHLQRVVRSKRRRRLLLELHAKAEHLFCKQIVVLLPRQ